MKYTISANKKPSIIRKNTPNDQNTLFRSGLARKGNNSNNQSVGIKLND